MHKLVLGRKCLVLFLHLLSSEVNCDGWRKYVITSLQSCLQKFMKIFFWAKSHLTPPNNIGTNTKKEKDDNIYHIYGTRILCLGVVI